MLVDDEPLALLRLGQLLALQSGVEVVGTAGNGREAIRLEQQLKPDLLFLDIRMPDLNGFDVLRSLSGPNYPAVVFVTAFDDHAIEAFKHAAADYVLKPVEENALASALERARHAVETRSLKARVDELTNLLESLQNRSSERSAYERELWVRRRGDMVRVPVVAIDRLQASGDYVEVHTGGKVYTIYDNLRDLEQRLDPALFLRVHRSHLIRRDQIDSISRATLGRSWIELRGGTRVPIGRTYLGKVRSLPRLSPWPE